MTLIEQFEKENNITIIVNKAQHYINYSEWLEEKYITQKMQIKNLEFMLNESIKHLRETLEIKQFKE